MTRLLSYWQDLVAERKRGRLAGFYQSSQCIDSEESPLREFVAYFSEHVSLSMASIWTWISTVHQVPLGNDCSWPWLATYLWLHLDLSPAIMLLSWHREIQIQASRFRECSSGSFQSDTTISSSSLSGMLVSMFHTLRKATFITKFAWPPFFPTSGTTTYVSHKCIDRLFCISIDEYDV